MRRLILIFAKWGRSYIALLEVQLAMSVHNHVRRYKGQPSVIFKVGIFRQIPLASWQAAKLRK